MTRKKRPSRSGPHDAEGAELMRSAHALDAAGRYREAEEAYRGVTRRQPRNVEAWCRHGLMLRHLGEFALARESFERALRLDRSHAESNIYLAAVYRQLDEVDKAIECFTRAAWAEPRDTRSFTGMASVYERIHELDKAEEAVGKALEVEPSSPVARVLLARLHRRRGRPERGIEVLRELISEEPTDETRFRAGFELARSLEALERYDEAFEAAREANEVQARTPVSLSVDDRSWLKLIRDGHDFTGEQFERWAATAPPDDGRAPVLLVGFPRSGTTLTEQILAAHPEIAVSDEQIELTPMYRAIFEAYDESAPLAGQVDAIPEDRLLAGRRAYRELEAPFLKAKPGATVVVNKNPMDLLALGVLSRVFPNARVIVAIRDPRDVCLSCFLQEFIANAANIHFFTLEGTVEMYSMVMDVWLAQREILRLPLLVSRYEDLTRDFERQARRLIEFVGVDWSDEVLRFHERANRRVVSTPSYEAVTSPVHTGALGRWRRFERQLSPILTRLEAYVRALGYEMSGTGEVGR